MTTLMDYTLETEGGRSPQNLGVHVKQTYVRSVQRALQRAGANEIRSSGGHLWQVLELPSGARIHSGSIREGRKRGQILHTNQVKDVVRQVEEAGLDPALFLALLDEAGKTSWHSKPECVVQWGQYLRGDKVPLDTVEDWSAAVRDFENRHRKEAPQMKPDKVQPEPKPETLETKPPPPKDHPVDTYTLVSMTGLTGKERTAASSFLSATITQGFGFGKRYLESGDVVRVPAKSGKSVVKRNFFTETAAVEIAEELIKRYGPPQEPEAEVEATLPALEAKVEPTPEPDVVTIPEPEPHPEPEPMPTPEPHPEPEPLHPGQALVYLCRRFGIEPVFKDKRMELDVNASLVALAQAVRSLDR